ncbi:hypothetical protein BL254_22870 [Protofrankia sp. BMG5.30]|nr:hypothetical protein BL254_22870 [Protofrankia sp. BMG5.30]
MQVGNMAAPPSGAVVTTALVLVLLGALTKSAQIPFHTWLPAAMVAPTPVSAYLHAAAMVKAGVFLVAALTPAFAGVDGWRIPVVVVGAATMLLGGVRALGQVDPKRMLTFGTISQLGFLTALVGFGSRTAALVGATMILAHGLFKAAMLMVVGIVDHQAGTRDLRVLSGLYHPGGGPALRPAAAHLGRRDVRRTRLRDRAGRHRGHAARQEHSVPVGVPGARRRGGARLPHR